jgi:uncharacterized membrane protein YeaQ/YmgE (transglycosylase-associated protein family)
MTWSMGDMAIQIVGGLIGGHAAAVAAKEHNFGHWGHTFAGAVGGALSGAFLQTFADTMVTASGSLDEPRFVDHVLLQVLTGFAAGGIVTLIAGFLKHAIDHEKSGKNS